MESYLVEQRGEMLASRGEECRAGASTNDEDRGERSSSEWKQVEVQRTRQPSKVASKSEERQIR